MVYSPKIQEMFQQEREFIEYLYSLKTIYIYDSDQLWRMGVMNLNGLLIPLLITCKATRRHLYGKVEKVY